MLTDEQKEKAGTAVWYLQQMLAGDEQALAPVYFGREIGSSSGKPFRVSWIKVRGMMMYMPEKDGRVLMDAQHILGIVPPLKAKRKRVRKVGDDTPAQIIEAYCLMKDQLPKKGKRDWSGVRHLANGLYPPYWSEAKIMNAFRDRIYKYGWRLHKDV
jgi:hypothetical protein